MKVHSLKGNINNAIDYILDETKTDYWISGTNRGVDPSVVGMYWQSEWKDLKRNIDTIRNDLKILQETVDRKSTRLNSSHTQKSRMPSSA